MSRLRPSLTTVLNLVLGSLLAFLLVRPGGIARTMAEEWRTSRESRKAIKEVWQELVHDAPTTSLSAHSPTPDVLVVVFSDYECPFCRELNRMLLEQPPAGLPGAVAWRHFPLSIHRRARQAAAIASWAAMTGSFERAHHLLFASDEWLSIEPSAAPLAAVAAKTDPRIEQCLLDGSADALIARDESLATRLSIRVTPTLLFRHGVRIDGRPDDRALFAELQRARQ